MGREFWVALQRNFTKAVQKLLPPAPISTQLLQHIVVASSVEEAKGLESQLKSIYTPGIVSLILKDALVETYAAMRVSVPKNTNAKLNFVTLQYPFEELVQESHDILNPL